MQRFASIVGVADFFGMALASMPVCIPSFVELVDEDLDESFVDALLTQNSQGFFERCISTFEWG